MILVSANLSCYNSSIQIHTIKCCVHNDGNDTEEHYSVNEFEFFISGGSVNEDKSVVTRQSKTVQTAEEHVMFG